MTKLEKKIDFMLVFEVKGANPNGDPLGGNAPREDYAGYGEVSDVCIKRKIRNRLQEAGNDIFVQSNDRIDDGKNSLEARFNHLFEEKKIKVTKDKPSDDEIYKICTEKWIDARAFGQVITFNSRSVGIRGAVSIGVTKSLSPIEVREIQITRSTNGMMKEGGKSSDTMGMKKYVDHAVYLVKGSINAYFAEKTGFSEKDAEQIKEALRTLFVNDSSSARPEGSMEVKKLYWFEHSSKIGELSSAKIFNLLTWDQVESYSNFEYEDYNIRLENLDKYGIVEKNSGKDGVITLEVIDGI